MKKNPSPQQMMEHVNTTPWDVCLVIVDDKLVGCGVYRTKEGLRKAISKFPVGCPEKVQVLVCTFDD